MQYRKELYSEELHDRWVALAVRQPFANQIMFQDKSIVIGSAYTDYRGELMICSRGKPLVEGYISGATIGLCTLEDVKNVNELTDSEWNVTFVNKNNHGKISSGWAYILTKPRRVIEFPVRTGKGFFDLVFTKDVIIEYPEFFYFNV